MFAIYKSKGASLLPGGPFLILTPSLSSYRRQLWISAKPVTHVEQGQETFTKTVAVWLRVEGVIDSGGHKVLVGGQGHNRTRSIQVNFMAHVSNEEVDRHKNICHITFES